MEQKQTANNKFAQFMYVSFFPIKFTQTDANFSAVQSTTVKSKLSERRPIDYRVCSGHTVNKKIKYGASIFCVTTKSSEEKPPLVRISESRVRVAVFMLCTRNVSVTEI